MDDTYWVEVGGKQYPVRYSITGGSLESIFAREDTVTVTVMIRATDSGWLDIYMPGSFLSRVGSIYPVSSELDFIIFVDELEVLGELQRGCDVALRVPFEAGSEQIDIVGTFLASGQESTPKGQHVPVHLQVEGKKIRLETFTNADTCDFSFDQSEKRFHAEFTGPMNEDGHFEVTLPHEFLGGPYTVLVDDQPVEFQSVFSNATMRHTTTISFGYEGKDVSSIDITGTTAIPEFPAVIGIVAASFGAVTLFTLSFKKFFSVR